MVVRCGWARGSPLEIAYHDLEWGVPVRDDRLLFEFLTLEGAQAGLSWSTILRKREGYRRAFSNFEPEKVAAFDRKKVRHLLEDPGIVRNRLKVDATILNARQVLKVAEEFGSFAEYIWKFVDGKPIQNGWRSRVELPSESEESRRMSREMKGRGFRFVGPVVCYAFMQAVGMVNDHEVLCFRHRQIQKLGG